MSIGGYKRQCYSILVDFMVDYKEQVFITGTKVNMKCSICHILPRKKRVQNMVIRATNQSINL